MENKNLNNLELNKENTIMLNENISLSPPSTINNNAYLSNNLFKDCSKKIKELKLKRKKVFGNKIKLIDWGNRGLIGVKENEVDIISYLNKKKKIDRDELCMKFNINPSFQERQILESIIKKNPMINIRKRDKDYLLRIKIRKIKYNKKFKNLKQAQDLRNILLLYSMINIEDIDEEHLLFQKHLSLNNFIKNEQNKKENGNNADNVEINNDTNMLLPLDQII